MSPLRLAFIVADEREAFFQYELADPYFGSAPSALLAGLEQCSDIEVHIVTCVRRKVRAPERLANNIFYHALQVPQWGFLRTGYLPAILKIRRKLRDLRPDIAHGQGTERYYALAAALSGFPNIITIHGNMRQVARALGANPFSFHWITARMESLAIRRTGGVVCLSRYTQAQVQALAHKTWLVPNAVDEAFFDVRRTVATPPTLVCVANVYPYKNQNLLIRTLDPIAAETGVRLVFLGGVIAGDPYGLEFLALVRERPWCCFEGFQKGDALRAHFTSASMMVLPTLEDNCPMVVLESMAAGVPVAAARIGGIPDLIDHRVNGLLFNPRDPADIRAAVLELLQPEASNRMAAEARKRALERYHPAKIARRHVEIYREVADAAPNPAKTA
ncbi:MAG TPA: glycosyltransferase family 4 protein [Candidatus Acidoferrum sp.]|nr:glycosyltransferase family 4 protein [Candidatus Acidoferrum sp.]